MSMPNSGLNTGANSPQFGEPTPVVEAIHAYVNERMHAMGTEIEWNLNERQSHLVENVCRGKMGAVTGDAGTATERA